MKLIILELAPYDVEFNNGDYLNEETAGGVRIAAPEKRLLREAQSLGPWKVVEIVVVVVAIFGRIRGSLGLGSHRVLGERYSTTGEGEWRDLRRNARIAAGAGPTCQCRNVPSRGPRVSVGAVIYNRPCGPIHIYWTSKPITSDSGPIWPKFVTRT